MDDISKTKLIMSMHWLEIMELLGKGPILFVARLFRDVICISILFIYLFIFVFLTALGLHCYVGFFSVYGE